MGDGRVGALSAKGRIRVIAGGVQAQKARGLADGVGPCDAGGQLVDPDQGPRLLRLGKQVPGFLDPPPVASMDGGERGREDQGVPSARQSVPAALLGLVDEDLLGTAAGVVLIADGQQGLGQRDELRVDDARSGGAPAMEDVEDAGNRRGEGLGKHGALLAKGAELEAVDLAVVLARDVAAVLGGRVLLDQVAVAGVGPPLGVLERGDGAAVRVLDADGVLDAAEGDGAVLTALVLVAVGEGVGAEAALRVDAVDVAASGAKLLEDGSRGGVEGDHGGLLVARVHDAVVRVVVRRELLDQLLHGQGHLGQAGAVLVGPPEVELAVASGLNDPDVVVDGAVVVVDDGAVRAEMGGLDHGVVGSEAPALLARLAVAGVEVSIDGRQKNKVFHFPVLQAPRNLLRETGPPGGGASVV